MVSAAPKQLASFVTDYRGEAIAVSELVLDSRQVRPGALFVAVDGSQSKGGDFIADACARGARAVLIDAAAGSVDAPVPVVAVADLAARVSAIAGDFYGTPSSRAQVIGVTGTNGKSTIVILLAQLFTLLGKKAGSIGTLGAGMCGGSVTETGLTTPDAISCQKFLAQLVADQAEVVAMEVSSHGIHQGRVAAIHYRAAILTNITHDHLDYHQSFAEYAGVKTQFVGGAQVDIAVINLDDASCAACAAELRAQGKPVVSYSLTNTDADVYVRAAQFAAAGVVAELCSPWGERPLRTALVGDFNLSNALACIASCCALGEDLDAVIAALAQVRPAPGRMQKIASPGGPQVYVDYAHTPDALQQALAALRRHVVGRLWVVFGCGGDRDRGKRPVMGEIASRGADVVVVTSDNPRSEDPMQILSDVRAGVSASDAQFIVDRYQAIRYAVQGAANDDCVLIAGKGHENYQILGSGRIHFSDSEVAGEALAERAGLQQGERS